MWRTRIVSSLHLCQVCVMIMQRRHLIWKSYYTLGQTKSNSPLSICGLKGFLPSLSVYDSINRQTHTLAHVAPLLWMWSLTCVPPRLCRAGKCWRGNRSAPGLRCSATTTPTTATLQFNPGTDTHSHTPLPLFPLRFPMSPCFLGPCATCRHILPPALSDPSVFIRFVALFPLLLLLLCCLSASLFSSACAAGYALSNSAPPQHELPHCEERLRTKSVLNTCIAYLRLFWFYLFLVKQLALGVYSQAMLLTSLHTIWYYKNMSATDRNGGFCPFSMYLQNKDQILNNNNIILTVKGEMCNLDTN